MDKKQQSAVTDTKEEPLNQESQKPEEIHPPLIPSTRPPFIPPFNKGQKIRFENKSRFFSRTRRGI